MTIYKSKRDQFFITAYVLLSLFLMIICGLGFFDETLQSNDFTLMLIIMTLINVVIWFLFLKITIKIQDQKLKVNIGFDVFKIDIDNITKVKIGETMWSGFHKYGTARGGLIIFSKNRNDLYITPEKQDDFLKQLLAINRHITIEDVRK